MIRSNIRRRKIIKAQSDFISSSFAGGGSPAPNLGALSYVPIDPDYSDQWAVPDKPVRAKEGLFSDKGIVAVGDIVAQSSGVVLFTANDQVTGVTYLYELLDVDIPTPSDGQTLTYSGARQKWISRKLTAADVGALASSYVPAWGDITGKPTTFTPSAHSHTKSDISDFPSSMPASDVHEWAKAVTKPTYTKSEVGLGNVDNTSDANKPISTEQQAALDKKLGKTETAADSNKLGGRDAADFWHKFNSNLLTVDWSARNITAAGDIIARTPQAVVFAANNDAAGGSQYLYQLLDVEVTNPVDGAMLVYDGTSQKWEDVDDFIIEGGQYSIN
ncbi:MAG: hypothetical protein ACRC77_10440 [Bacteroidales bacterium]